MRNDTERNDLTTARRPTTLALFALITIISGCDLGKVTVNTTAKVLARAQPSINQESDYEMAARAIPGSLKTVEGFWIVSPENETLIGILAQGYCQYGIAFVEDEWEAAQFKHDFAAADYHEARATKMFTRCLNYSLKLLGERWQNELFGNVDTVKKLIADATPEQRTPMMWAAVAMGSIIQHNLSNTDMFGQLNTVNELLEKVLEFDAKEEPADKSIAALPHVAMGQIYAGRGASAGGDPKKAIAEFEKAMAITADKDHPEGRYLLPRVMMAYKVGKQTNDKKFFHDNLLKVLQTPPSIWPEQRLANEVAQRRARRYLTAEKELFP